MRRVRTVLYGVGTLALLGVLAPGGPDRAHAQINRGRGRGQIIGPGSTVQGDILRGEGIFLQGAGVYNYYSAQANAINTNTWIQLNEYLFRSAQLGYERAAKRRAEDFKRRKEHHKKILDRIANHPEDYDLERGDALNSLFERLADPQITPSAFRTSPVPLSGDMVRAIPFFYGPEDATISLQRITSHGKWPVGFRGAPFASERDAYEHAVDTALGQQLEGKLSREAIQAVETAVHDLAVRLDQVISPSGDKVYVEARNHLRRLENAKELFKRRAIEQILGDIDKYSGTTVHELVVFMQRNNLRFGVPDIGDERALYPELYASMRQQLDMVTGSNGGTR